MFRVTDFSIDFLTGSPLAVWLAAVVLLLLSFYLYRKPNPPLSFFLKAILTGLRVVATLALVFTLAEPVISFVRQFERPRKITLLVDASGSMNRSETGKTRRERVDSVFASRDFSDMKDAADLTAYYFAENLSASRVEIKPEKTALGDVIEQLQIKQMSEASDYWLLFSDGNSNSGQDARRAASLVGRPITTVDMSLDTGAFDVRITDVNYNPVLFVGQPTEISVKLAWQNVSQRNLVVRLSDSLRVAGQQMFPVQITEGLGQVTFNYTPDEPGQKILRVEIPAEVKEENSGNNRRSFSVKVLKSRLMVLLAADHPDYEVGFLKRLLEQSDKYVVELLATGSKSGNLSGRFPSRQNELNRYDLIILHDPDPGKLESRRDLLKSYLSERGGAMWVLMGPQFSQRGPVEWFNDMLPFYQSRRENIEYISFHGEPSESHLYHPAVRLGDSPATIRENWAKLPPFQALVRCDQIHSEASTLVYTALSPRHPERFPILGYRRHGPGKLFTSAAMPFWTWGFVNLGFGEEFSSYENFVEGAISWLTVSDDLDPIRVKPEKEVFHRGETVRFDGFAFDVGFRPITDVAGTVNLTTSDGPRYETDLIPRGDGVYRAEFFNISPGRYRYRAKFEKDGQLLKESTGAILVESFSIEEIDPSGDPATLAAIAQVSGGGYFRFDEFGRAVESLDLSLLNIEEQKEIKVLNRLWLLIIFVGAVCAEWLIRKVNQLL